MTRPSICLAFAVAAAFALAPAGPVVAAPSVQHAEPFTVSVPVADIDKVEVKEAAGRLSLKIAYRAGLNNVKTSAWVEELHRAELDELVAAVQGAKGSPD